MDGDARREWLMSDEIPACPECDSSRMHPNSGGQGGGEAEAAWRCKACHESFEDPNWRPRHRQKSDRTRSPHANALLDADPDEVGL